MDTKRLLPDSLYILRGFGLFQLELGDGEAGKASVNTLRSAPTNDKEIFRDARLKCPINNWARHSPASLKFGTTRMGAEDEFACLLSDSPSVPTTVSDKLGRRLPAPWGNTCIAKAVADQINYLGLIYSSRRREERISALRFLLEIHEVDPEFPTVGFICSVWGRAHYDFFKKCPSG